MSQGELDAIEATVMEAAAKITGTRMDQSMPGPARDGGPRIVAQGRLRDADSFHRGSGGVAIYRLPDGSLILRLEDIRVTNGPALHVLLASHAGPASRDDVAEGYVDLGPLKGNLGSQNYEITADTDLSQYQSVVIYCMPFHVVFATAMLE